MFDKRIYLDFSTLKGKVLKKIGISENEIHFYTECEKHYIMKHEQDCCETVSIEDISGAPIECLIGDPVLLAEERTSKEDGKHDNSFTWTFYEIATIQGSVTIRWFGESNGYYSESVDFFEVLEEKC